MPDSLEQTLGQLLTQHNLWLAVAESCSGGLLSHRITNISGSSAYFIGGVIAYANAVKETLLGVPGEVLAQHGAVSPQTALAMAQGVRRALQTDIGLSTTGIAGPGGGTPDKPVGLAYVAIAAPGLEKCVRCLESGQRQANKAAFAETALRLALDYMQNYGKH